MVLDKVLCMNGGNGETSYASNSLLQKIVISKARPVLQDTVKKMFHSILLDKCTKVADLGCSSGQNTLLVVTDIMDTIYGMSKQMNRNSPEFLVFLNDLPENDFNNIFKKLPAYYDNLKKDKDEMFGSCFISGMPGSFYKRLFPSRMLHLIHSSYSLHWLSKVPDGLENNKGNIYMAKSSPIGVFKAYGEQFQRDFSRFLSLRSEELVSGGRMVLTFIGRSIADPTSKDCHYLWELLSKSLKELIVEGLVEETALDTFNMPFYTPYPDEVRKIVEEEGTFNLDKLEVFEVNWDPTDDIDNKDFVFDKYESGQRVANCIRAVMEPMLARHFGETIIDKLFDKYKSHVADHLCVEKTKFVNIVISLLNKGP